VEKVLNRLESWRREQEPLAPCSQAGLQPPCPSNALLGSHLVFFTICSLVELIKMRRRNKLPGPETTHSKADTMLELQSRQPVLTAPTRESLPSSELRIRNRPAPRHLDSLPRKAPSEALALPSPSLSGCRHSPAHRRQRPGAGCRRGAPAGPRPGAGGCRHCPDSKATSSPSRSQRLGVTAGRQV